MTTTPTTPPKSKGNKKAQAAQMKANKETLLSVFYAKRGNVTKCCKAANISRQTFSNYLKSDPEFAAAIDDAREELVDHGEDVIYDAGKGDWRAMHEWLKVKGRPRGWGNTVDLKHTMDINVESDPDFDDE